MDIRCPKCGEPWDHDTLHEEVQERIDYLHENATYAHVAAEFRRDGCGAFRGLGMNPCQPVKSAVTAAAQAVYELMGDDMDGAASFLDDAEAIGLLLDD